MSLGLYCARLRRKLAETDRQMDELMEAADIVRRTASGLEAFIKDAHSGTNGYLLIKRDDLAIRYQQMIHPRGSC